MRDRAAKGRYATGEAHWIAKRGGDALPRGERHHNSKLTAAQVADIRSSYTGKHGEQSLLGRKHGVTSGAIWRVVHHQSWADSAQGEAK